MPRNSDRMEGGHLLDKKPIRFGGCLVNHNNLSNRMSLPRRWVIQVSALSAVMLVYWTNMAKTGDGGLGFDSGEGARETATTSKEAGTAVV